MGEYNKEKHYLGYLDEAFDDAKNEEDLRRAKSASRRGCLISAIIVAVLLLILGPISCSAAAFIGSLA